MPFRESLTGITRGGLTAYLLDQKSLRSLVVLATKHYVLTPKTILEGELANNAA